MARTCAVQVGIEATIRSPRSALRCPKRGSVLTVRAMHSVAERTSGRIAALFCCADKVGAIGVSTVGPVATLTTSAAAASGARIISSSPPAVKSYRHMLDSKAENSLGDGVGY